MRRGVSPALGGDGERAVLHEPHHTGEVVSRVEFVLGEELVGGRGPLLHPPLVEDDLALAAEPFPPAEALDPDSGLPHHIQEDLSPLGLELPVYGV
jgi:hypothetical protein